MDIQEALDKLLLSLKESPEYRRYEEAKKGMQGNDEARMRMDDFRAHAYKVNNSPEHPDPLDDMKELMLERLQVRRETAVDEYLTAEMELCRLMQHICLQILQVTDMEIDGFADQL